MVQLCCASTFENICRAHLRSPAVRHSNNFYLFGVRIVFTRFFLFGPCTRSVDQHVFFFSFAVDNTLLWLSCSLFSCSAVFKRHPSKSQTASRLQWANVSTLTLFSEVGQRRRRILLKPSRSSSARTGKGSKALEMQRQPKWF